MDENTTREITEGGAAIVRAEGDVAIREGGALAIVAGGDTTITQGGAGFLIVGGSAALEQAGAGNMLVGGDVEMRECRVGQMVALEADVSDSKVGLVIGGNVSMANSQVMLSTAQAAALGAAAGGVLFLLSRLFRRR